MVLTPLIVNVAVDSVKAVTASKVPAVVEAVDAIIVPASPKVSRDKSRILAVERDAVARAVKSHVQGRSGCGHSVNRAAAGACRKLNDIGKASTNDADGFALCL